MAKAILRKGSMLEQNKVGCAKYLQLGTKCSTRKKKKGYVALPAFKGLCLAISC
jgi:hypothetical protein